MNHLFRFIWILLTSPFRPRHTDWNKPTCLNFRVWFTDLDLIFHMNNGIYLSLMDLGRMDSILKGGGFFKLYRKGIYPVLASESIVFRRSLNLFTKFQIYTRIADWDDKYFYLTQQFVVKGDIYASAVVKGRFLNKKGQKLSPTEIWAAMEVEPPQLQSHKIKEDVKRIDEELRNQSYN